MKMRIMFEKSGCVVDLQDDDIDSSEIKNSSSDSAY